MTNNYIDKSNYVKGLLLMIGKDKKITDEIFCIGLLKCLVLTKSLLKAL